MSPTEIKALINSDPQAKAHFDDRDDWSCAARLNEIAPPVRVPVPSEVLLEYGVRKGVWGGIRIAADSTSAPTQLRAICITLIDWIKNKWPIDLDLPEVQQMFQVLVQSGLVSEQQQSEIQNLAYKKQEFTALQIEYVRTRF